MTFGAGTLIGNGGSSSTNQGSITATLTAQANAGTFVWILFAMDNLQTTTGDEGAVSSVTDSAGGNTWEKAVEFANPSGSPAAQAGATASLWYCRALVNAIPNGGTITATLAVNTRDASAWTARSHTKDSQTRVVVEKTGTLANNAADPGSLNATTINVPCLRIRGIASETNSTTALTVTSTWTENTGNRSGSGSAAANITARAEFLISTGTGAASDPTYVSADHASVYVAFREEPVIAAARGVFNMNGQVVGRIQTFVAGLGSFTFSGQPVVTKRVYPLTAAFGNFTLGGQTVGKRLTFAASVGVFTFSGKTVTTPTVAAPDHLGVADIAVAGYPVGGSGLVDPTAGQPSMPAAFGSFSLSGQAVALMAPAPDFLGVAHSPISSFPVAGARLPDPVIAGGPAPMPVGFGSFSLVGQVVGKRQSMAVGLGSFSFNGGAVTKRQTITVGFGSFTLSGQAVTKRQTVTVGFGSFTLNGQAVGRRQTFAAGYGSFTMAGQAVVLKPPGLRMSAFFGNFQLNGQVVGSRRSFAVGYGAFSMNGQPVGLRRGYTATASFGNFTLSGQQVSFGAVAAPDHLGVADASVASFPVAGSRLVDPVGPAFFPMPVGFGTFNLVGQSVANLGYHMPVATGFFFLTGAISVTQRAMRVGYGSFTMNGQPVQFIPPPGGTVEAPDFLGVAHSPVSSFPIAGARLPDPVLPTADEALGVAAAPVASFSVAGSQLVDPVGPPGFSMPVGFGSFTMAGQAVANLGYHMPVATGFFFLVGAISITQRAMRVGYGAFTMNGQPVQFIPAPGGTSMLAARGIFNLFGQDVGSRRALKLPAEYGNFSLNGQQVGLRRLTKVAAQHGTFTFSGPGTVSLLRLGRVPAAFGNFQLNGQQVALKPSGKISAQFGLFTLNGQPVGRRQSMAIGFGSFSLNGQPVGRRLGMAASFGLFTLTGQAVSKRQTFAGGVGTFTLGGQQVGLKGALRLPVGFGSFSLVGSQVVLPGSIAAGRGVFNLLGQQVTLATKHRMPVGFGLFTFTGQPVGLLKAGSGALVAGTASMDGDGTSGSSGTAALVAQLAQMAGAGLSSSDGSGALVAGVAHISGAGEVASTGSGSLVQGLAHISGSGLSASFGSGAMVAGLAHISATIDPLGSVGSGNLVAGLAHMRGMGLTGPPPVGPEYPVAELLAI